MKHTSNEIEGKYTEHLRKQQRIEPKKMNKKNQHTAVLRNKRVIVVIRLHGLK